MEHKSSTTIDIIINEVAKEETLSFANKLKTLMPQIIDMAVSFQWSSMAVAPRFNPLEPVQILVVCIRFDNQFTGQVEHTTRYAIFHNNQFHVDWSKNPNISISPYWQVEYTNEDAELIRTSPVKLVGWHYLPDMSRLDYANMPAVYPANPLVVQQVNHQQAALAQPITQTVAQHHPVVEQQIQHAPAPTSPTTTPTEEPSLNMGVHLDSHGKQVVVGLLKRQQKLRPS